MLARKAIKGRPRFLAVPITFFEQVGTTIPMNGPSRWLIAMPSDPRCHAYKPGVCHFLRVLRKNTHPTLLQLSVESFSFTTGSFHRFRFPVWRRCSSSLNVQSRRSCSQASWISSGVGTYGTAPFLRHPVLSFRPITSHKSGKINKRCGGYEECRKRHQRLFAKLHLAIHPPFIPYRFLQA